MSNFVHLHTHSHYSLCDAAVSVKKLIEKAHQLEMPALALTDHGNLFGVIEFYKEAKKKGINPIIGCELYISNTPHTQKSIKQGEKNYHHLVALASSNEGYYNLVKLVSLAYTEGFYYKPRVDKAALKEYSKGLIGLSACIAGEIPSLILKGDKNKAISVIEEYQDIFGRERFFLELQDHGIDKQAIINEALIDLSKNNHVPLVASNDVHYLNQEDSEAHDILLCIGKQKKVTDQGRMSYPGDQFYFKSYEEMRKLFPDVPEALENTLKIAEMCHVEFDFQDNIPDFDVPKGYDQESYFKYLCEEGLKKRYSIITQKEKDRLDYELDVICKMGFAGYFLIVWDFINYAKSNNIAVGPGRGSAAGSLVAYTLGITDLDPLKYNLFFERFLNPDRVSMPDIDTDFQDEKRDQVIEYVIRKYGKEKVAGIITFGALKARAVIRDVGRVLDIPLNEVDRIAKLIPGGPGSNLEKAYKETPELKSLVDSNTSYQKLFSLAKKLEGLNRHAGTHAAGIVIGQNDLSTMVPLYSEQKTGSISTQFEGKYLEECGLLKMDFLGLKNLSVIKKCIDLIEETRGEKLDIINIPLDDEKAFALFQKGESLGVFQLESSGMQELMKKLKPNYFEDIIALIALYRPGPLNSGMADEFIQRKRNPQKIKFDHPFLESILKETYGVIVYQEQVMEIARTIGGFSMGKADELRKAMGKKLVDKMNDLKKVFVQGAIDQEIDQSFAENLYDQMAKFGEYGFNKSHSAAYALITYQTAYLKSNYSIEYMTALLSCDKDNIDKVVEYISESKKMGIDILAPSVNESGIDFSVEDEQIRFGLSAIKNVGITAVQSIIASRKEHGLFKSIFDLCEKVDLRVVNKKVLECLINSGACDVLGYNRASHFSIIDRALEYAQQAKADKESGQFNLFGEEEKTKIQLNTSISQIQEWDMKEILTHEKEVLGFYISGHPLDKHLEKINKLKLNRIASLKELEEGGKVAICGLVHNVEFKVSKKKTQYGIIQLEGMSGSCEVMFFKDNFTQVKPVLEKDKILYIRGKLQSVEPRVKVFGEEAKPLEDINEANYKPLPQPKRARNASKYNSIKHQYVNIEIKDRIIRQNKFEELEDLKRFFLNHKGNTPIYLHFPPDGVSSQHVTVKAGDAFNIQASEELIDRVQNFACVEKVWIQ